MMKRLVSPNPGARRTLLARGDEPSSPNAIMCSLRIPAPALVPATVTPWALRWRTVRATSVPPRMVDRRSWLPPVKKIPVACASRAIRLSSWQSRRVSKSITSTRPTPNSWNSCS